jgi:hypothetical protein
VIFGKNPDLFVRDASAVTVQRPLFESNDVKYPCDVSPSGRHLLFTNTDDDANLWILDLESGDARAWLETEYTEEEGRFSPGGDWVAYESDESGLREIYLQSFPEIRERIVVSSGGGRNAAWRSDGSELYYMSASGMLMAVPITWDSGRPRPGEPRALFQAQLRWGADFDVYADGETFLLNRHVTEEEGQPFVLVQNWESMLP